MSIVAGKAGNVFVPDATAIRLDIGAGDPAENARRREMGLPCRPDGAWLTVDAFCPADVKAMMWDLPYADRTVDEIWASHSLEHVALADVRRTLAEWFRVLRPGGTATIQVPDFSYAARYWLDHPDELWAQQLVFGLQSHPGEFHRCAFTEGTLRDAVRAAGFVGRVLPVWDYSQQTLRAEVRRP